MLRRTCWSTLHPIYEGTTVSLPFPKQTFRVGIKEGAGDSTVSISDLLNEYSKLIPRCMTLSSNTWGLCSLLYGTFFNPDIDCNLVSASLNPAFAVIDSISPGTRLVATFLVNRQPWLGLLWLSAILTGLAKSILREIGAGMTALDLPASA